MALRMTIFQIPTILVRASGYQVNGGWNPTVKSLHHICAADLCFFYRTMFHSTTIYNYISLFFTLQRPLV